MEYNCFHVVTKLPSIQSEKMTTCLDSPCAFQVLMVDTYGLLSGTGAIIHPHIIISSAQHFEGYVFCVFIEKRYKDLGQS